MLKTLLRLTVVAATAPVLAVLPVASASAGAIAGASAGVSNACSTQTIAPICIQLVVNAAGVNAAAPFNVAFTCEAAVYGPATAITLTTCVANGKRAAVTGMIGVGATATGGLVAADATIINVCATAVAQVPGPVGPDFVHTSCQDIAV